MSKPFKNACIVILITLFSGCSTFSLRSFFNRDDIAVSLSALLKEDNPDEELRFNSINSVYFLKDKSDIIVTGKECIDENGLLLSDILYAATVILKNDRMPYVFIGHTQKDLKNHKEFISDMYRPMSPVPEKVISDWESKSGKRPVITKNLERNAHISQTLYKTDLLLKKILHGKERLWIKDIQSFKGYLSNFIQNLFERSKPFSIPYNNRFWLSPDTTSIDLSENHLSLPSVSLSLTPEQSFYNFSTKNSLKDSLYLEKKEEYSDLFNSKMEEVYYKKTCFQFNTVIL
ncbi:MAG: hypothetical protein ACOCSE_00630 [Chitinivibrionales bacterium]